MYFISKTNSFLNLALIALMLTTPEIASSQAALKHLSKDPLGKILLKTYEKILPAELIELVFSYMSYVHSCKENVPVYSLEVLPDNTIAAGLGNGEIHIIDPQADPLQKKAVVRILKGHTGGVTALKWLKPQGLLLSGSTVNGYGILGIEEQMDKKLGAHSLSLIAILHNSINLQNSDERILLWNPTSSTPAHIIYPQEKYRASWKSLVRSKYINACFSQKTSICKRVLNLATKEHRSDIILESSPRAVLSAKRTYTLDCSGYFVEGCADGSLVILSHEEHRDQALLCKGHTKPLRAIKEIAPGLFMTAAEDGIINIFSVTPAYWIKKIDNSFRGPVYALAVLHCQHGPLIVAGFADGSLQMYTFEANESIQAQKQAAELVQP